MLTCGLLGEKLGHSFSPRIHALLGTYTYDLFEKKPEEAENFIRNGAWDAINVTIPYKKTAAALCDVLSERARRLKSVNTLVRRADGRLFGDNTDWFGFETMIRTSGLSVAERVLSKIPEIGFMELTSRDVVRHPLVQKIVDAYARYEEKEAAPKRPGPERGGKRR